MPSAAPALSAEKPTVALSAEEIHRHLLKCHRLEGCVRLDMAKGLHTLNDEKLLDMLGFSNIYGYANFYFGYKTTTTRELIRVAKALDEIPHTKDAFLKGDIHWSALEEISRIAKRETEDEWIEFARGLPIRRLEAEVKDALERKREKPRDRSWSLRSIYTVMNLKLTVEQREMLDKAIAKVSDEISERTGGGEVDRVGAILFMAQRMLETDPEGKFKDRAEKKDSMYTILYHECPDCQKATVVTTDGPVEVPREVVQRIEDVAEKVVVRPEDIHGKESASKSVVASGLEKTSECEKTSQCEKALRSETSSEIKATSAAKPEPSKPNSPALTRRVLLRDGLMCANPFCRRKIGLHSHHINPRGEGGPSIMKNELAVCTYCHSLCHAGYLKVEGNPELAEVRWSPSSEKIQASFEESLKLVASLGIGTLDLRSRRAEAAGRPAAEAGCDDGRPAGRVNGAGRPSRPGRLEIEDHPCFGALVRNGFSRPEARRVLGDALVDLPRRRQRDPTYEDILRVCFGGAGVRLE